MERDWEEANRIFLHEMHEYYFVSEWSGVVLGAFCWNNTPPLSSGGEWGGLGVECGLRFTLPLWQQDPVRWFPSLFLSLTSVK